MLMPGLIFRARLFTVDCTGAGKLDQSDMIIIMYISQMGFVIMV